MLDAAVTLYRARFRSLMFVSAIVVIPVQILSSLVLLSARPDEYGYSFGTTGPQFTESNAALQLGAFVAVIVVQAASTAFVVAACTRVVADAYIDQTTTSQEALGNAARRFFALITVSFIVSVAQLVGTFACFVGTFVPMAFFAVAVPVLILERVGVGMSLGRSVNLVKANFWRTLGLVVTAQVLTTVVSLGLTAAAELVIRGDSSSTSSIIVQGVAAALSALITTAFVATATVVLYFDLRIRDEAFDVQLMMQRDDARVATA
ncbi:MAG TPA: hypothetical protein VNC41_05825 [Acidimicrobiia bacterium]|nr:hypothetical protein [Acidimicrobiia bacterium]